jgi:hypothetical protein
LPKVSAKKRRHKAAEKALGAWEHMQSVKGLPCLVCGCYGVEVHHLPSPRSDFRVIPLCPPHHRREYSTGSYHYSRKAFNAAHGSDDALLARVAAMLAGR